MPSGQHIGPHVNNQENLNYIPAQKNTQEGKESLFSHTNLASCARDRHLTLKMRNAKNRHHVRTSLYPASERCGGRSGGGFQWALHLLEWHTVDEDAQ